MGTKGITKPIQKVRRGIGTDNHDVEIEGAAVGSTDPTHGIFGHGLGCNVDVRPKERICDTRSTPHRRKATNNGTQFHVMCRLIPKNAYGKALDSVD
jgi:hypothetical protein